MVVRFSAAEMAVVRERARLAGASLAAWIGRLAVDASGADDPLVELLRLHSDIVAARRAGLPAAEAERLLARLDLAVSGALGRGPR